MNIPEALACPYCGTEPQHVRSKIRPTQSYGDHQDARDHIIKCVSKECKMRPRAKHHILKHALVIWNQRP